jgi:hypothetical protein
MAASLPSESPINSDEIAQSIFFIIHSYIHSFIIYLFIHSFILCLFYTSIGMKDIEEAQILLNDLADNIKNDIDQNKKKRNIIT